MTHLEPLIRLSIFWGVFLLMAIWERLAPRRLGTQPKLKRWLINIGLSVLNGLLVRLTLGAALYLTSIYVDQHQWGALPLLKLFPMMNLVLGLILMDFAIYIQHVLFHALPLLWRLHQIHHSDLDFDVTTAIRFHPLEIFVSLFYKMVVVVAFGIPPLAILIYETLLSVLPMFHHSNIHISHNLDGSLRWLIVTPDMHRVHHSTRTDEINSNFGVATSLWDRLCGTYCSDPIEGQLEMEIGLRPYRYPEQVDFWHLLFMPFKKGN